MCTLWISKLLPSQKPGLLSLFSTMRSFLPTGYNIYRQDRGSRGGGVMLAVKDSLPSKLLLSPGNLEIVTVSVNTAHQTVLCFIYLLPNSTQEHTQPIFDYIKGLFLITSSIIILGDLNFPDINWETLLGGSQASNNFCDLVFDYNLSQLIEEPTHIGGNILDLIITNSDELVHNVVVNPHNTIIFSDHFIITFHICLSTLPVPPKATYYSYDYSKADFSRMEQYIINSCHLQYFEEADVKSTWNIISSVITDAISLFVPVYQSHHSQYLVWFNSNLRHQMKCFCTRRRTYRRSPTAHNLSRLFFNRALCRPKHSMKLPLSTIPPLVLLQ